MARISTIFAVLIIALLLCQSVYSQQTNFRAIRNTGVEFIENKGQIADQFGKPNPEVLFNAEVENGLISVRKQGISFTFIKLEKFSSESKSNEKDLPLHLKSFEEPDSSVLHFYRVDMNLLNSQQPSGIIKKEMTEDYNNYYLAHCPDGITFVRKYRKVILENVYPNIDLVLYSNDENNFQYDFVVKPGGDPKQISFRFDGAERVELTDAGDLRVITPFGNIEHRAPVAYQISSIEDYASRIPTPIGVVNQPMCKFKIAEDKTIRFDVKEYDKELLLVLDPPTLMWGTYYGGSGDDYCYSLATDVDGNVYIAGATSSSSTIATSDAHQVSLSGLKEAFIVKFNKEGMRQWGTYYGGSGIDDGRGVTVDFGGYVYLCGTTNSMDAISTSGAHQSTLGGGYDAFLAKFNSNGFRLWSSYFGGSGADYGFSITTDVDGNVYLSGETGSTDGIATFDGFQTFLGGSKDAFLAKFSSGGTFKWGTYFGGIATETGRSIVTDSSGNIYLAGFTSSVDGIALFDAHQANFGGGVDAFLVKFNNKGEYQWGTYYGGAEFDFGRAVAVDGDGNIYLAGDTYSTNSIATVGSYKVSHENDNRDAFLVKFNANGVRQWATYYGGNDNDFGNSLATDSNGNVYLAGYTLSVNGIASDNSFQNSKSDSTDAFLVKFNSYGNRQWGTYFGGDNNDVAIVVATDGNENVFLAGYTSSTDLAITPNAHQSIYNGASDAFLVKFAQEASAVEELPKTQQHNSPLDFELIPNPAEGNVLVRVRSLENCNIDIVVTDILGVEQIILKDKEVNTGITDIPLDLKGYFSGFYLLTVRSPIGTATKVLKVLR